MEVWHFLDRSLSSGQNYVGLSSGEVVCARAIVRVVPSIRWSPDMISRINVSPLTFKIGTLDKIEEQSEPQAHTQPNPDDAETAPQRRRLQISDVDILKYGYTESCQRCRYQQQGQTLLARGVRHNEACRKRIYDALREDGAKKMQRADLDPSRTQTKGKKSPEANPVEAQPTLDEAPTEPLVEMADIEPDVTPRNEPEQVMVEDTQHFYEEVDKAMGDSLEVDWTGGELHDPDNDHVMSSMIDVLQTVGVSVGDATAYATMVIKDRAPISAVQAGQQYDPTFFELYGKGNLVRASHGCRRHLHVNGLDAFDLRTMKPNGEYWDFSKSADRQLAKSMVETLKPMWVIGSPPCTFFSAWNQGINLRRMDPAKVELMRAEAVKHLHFVMGIYKMQLDGGRHFLHEHPATASSWSDPWVIKMLQHPRVSALVSHQCEYGLLTPDSDGVPTPAKKPTRWMSSSSFMLERLSRRCSGDHTHQHLSGGRAKAAEDYSIELITEILRGIRDTADAEEKWGDECHEELSIAMIKAGLLHDVKTINVASAYAAEDKMAETKNLTVQLKHADGRTEPTNLVFKDVYRDEYTHEDLPIEHVKVAMHDELTYFCDKVWELVPVDEVEGKVIGSRWVNCNKNDITDPDVRCRLVGQEVNLYADDSFYAATPPLEAKRMLFTQFSTERTRNGKPLQISFVDVKKAYFYGIPERSLYVRLPPELGVSKKYVGKLVRCMYGTRDAGAIWESCYTSALVKIGFIQGGASPCCFYHPIWQVNVVVHGDDFTALGTPEELTMYEKGMQEVFECKLKGRLGTGPEDCKEMRVLNRIVRVTDNGLLYEADPRHAEMLIKAFQLEGAKGVVTPGVKSHEANGDPETIDQDFAHEINGILAELRHKVRPMSKVSLCPDVEYYDVVPYSQIYGRHPRHFHFDSRGKMIRADDTPSNDYMACAHSVSPNERRAILERTLKNGAAWETSSIEFIAKVSKNQFTKSRLGSKAARHAERMEILATNWRAKQLLCTELFLLGFFI